MKPIKINHGKVFNKHQDWYIFYCGKCEELISLIMKLRPEYCKFCKERIDWEEV